MQICNVPLGVELEFVIVVVTGTLPPVYIPLDGSPDTVTPASVPVVADPEPEPEVVQNASATPAIARTPTALSAITARFFVNLTLNIH